MWLLCVMFGRLRSQCVVYHARNLTPLIEGLELATAAARYVISYAVGSLFDTIKYLLAQVV